jgi:uncharacterized protein (UPF0333 family)
MKKMTRQPLILAVSLAAALALSACGKTDESNSQMPPATPASTPAPAATAAAAMGGTAATAVTFGTVELGSTVGADNKVVASSASFAPKDTIYASVDTSGSGHATLAAKWSYQDGQVVHEDSKTLDAMGPQTTAFMISKPDGLQPGNYKVDITMDGKSVASKDFSVK